MKKLLIIILLFFCIGYAYGGENITTYDDAPIAYDDDFENTTVSLDDGHLDTRFSNGYKGYCIEYAEQEAKTGDKFYITSSEKTVNNKTKKDVSQYLKRYFVDYYNETKKDKIVTQHMIWHFTDDFEGWRLNYTIINNIKNSNNNYDDDGTIRWNSTHNMRYSFRALISQYEHHQNYFIYKISFEPITQCNISKINESSTTNSTNNSEQPTSEIIDNLFNSIHSDKTNNQCPPIKKEQTIITLKTKQTGIETRVGIIFLTMITTLAILYRPKT